MRDAGRELDELVGEKVMGWKVLSHHEPGVIKHLIDENQCEVRPAEFKPYSIDIAAAWEVVMKICHPNSAMRFKIDYRCDEGWWVTFEKSFSEGSVANGHDAPHAICLAALMVVGVEA